jgi:hypothetical protein
MVQLRQRQTYGPLRHRKRTVPPVVAPWSHSALISRWHAQEASLARALAEAAKPYLCAVERDDVYVAIGTGERFAAIRQMIKSVAVKRIPLRADLVQWCVTWLHAYVGHEDEGYLRHLIEDVLMPCAIRVPRSAP